MEKESALQPLDTVGILQTIGNTLRKSVLTALASRHTTLKFSELMEASGLNPNFDTGQFWYHLSELMSRDITIKNEDRYGLSQFGYKPAEILDIIELECFFS